MRRWLIPFLLALVALPASAVTRLYLSGAPENSLPSLVAADGGWEETNERQTGRLRTKFTVPGTANGLTGQTVDITEDTGNQEIDREFVTAPLPAGTTFTSGSTTVTAQIAMREFQTTDDVTQCILGVRVLATDGASVQATLLAVANYGTSTELNNSAVRNKTCANGDAVTASYTSVAGDRLAVAVGYQTDGAETTPQAASLWGGDSVTECPVDETTATCMGWIEFSNTFTLEEDTEVTASNTLASGANSTDLSSYSTSSVTPLANRLYLLLVFNTHGTSATLPTVTGASMTWDQVTTVLDASNLNRLTLFRSENASPGSGTLTVDYGGTTQTNFGYYLTEWSGTEDDVGSNGSGAIVQTKTGTAATGTSLTVTLDNAVGSSRNGVYGAIYHATNEAQTVETGHEEMGQRAFVGRQGNQWTYNDTTTTQTWTTSSISLGIAVEIKRDVAESAARGAIVIN